MKTIYSDIITRLKAKVPELRWIDLDYGQLESPERPAVAFPSALITIDIPQADDITDNIQDCVANITIRLAFDNPGRTAAATPTKELNRALTPYDTAGNVYAALQGWHTAHFDPLSRRSQRKENNRYGLFVYSLQFQTRFFDETKKSEE